MKNENEYHRLFWQCRRGMLELDILLMNFLEKHFLELTAEELIVLQRLLSQNDTMLAHWFLSNGQADDKDLEKMIFKIKDKFNKTYVDCS